MSGAPFPVPGADALTEAFRWSAHRNVSKTALVSLHGNRYQVDPQLVGRRVELLFDPFDLATVFVRVDGTDAGTALPHQITRHAHPKARPETPTEPARPTTGIDYLALLDADHSHTLADKVNYTALALPTSTGTGQA
jgi:putative transposase